MKKRNSTEHIIIHAAATKPSMDIGVEEIKQWHLARNFSDTGYHFVIRQNAVVEKGRARNLIGAHAKGWNRKAVGICLVGGLSENGKHDEFNFNTPQLTALRKLIEELQEEYGDLQVMGHNETTTAKSCPTFNVPAWYTFGDIVLASGVKMGKF